MVEIYTFTSNLTPYINQVIGHIAVNIKPEFVRHILWVEILQSYYKKYYSSGEKYYGEF